MRVVAWILRVVASLPGLLLEVVIRPTTPRTIHINIPITNSTNTPFIRSVGLQTENLFEICLRNITVYPGSDWGEVGGEGGLVMKSKQVALDRSKPAVPAKTQK